MESCLGEHRAPVAIQRKKGPISDRDLLRELPTEFRQISAYLERLDYASNVDYGYIGYLVLKAMKTVENVREQPFDWEGFNEESVPRPSAREYLKCFPEIETADFGCEERDKCELCSVA
jgi:hypothetical protein